MGSRERLFKGGVFGCQWKQPSEEGENDKERRKKKAGEKMRGWWVEEGSREGIDLG